MILALFLVSFPWISALLPSVTDKHPVSDGVFYRSETINVAALSLLFRDLKNEGLLRTAKKAIYMSNGDEETMFYMDQIAKHNEMELILSTDSERQGSIPDDTVDFALVPNFPSSSEFIDHKLKVGGIIALQLSKNPLAGLMKKQARYKIVYLRRIDQTTVMAMKKTGHTDTNSATQRRLFGYEEEAKKAALENLEDVLLEPPRAASGKSHRYMKRTKYLPDLMGDTLERYPRRVFIEAGSPESVGRSSSGWFAKHYPTRNKNFEMYKIETVTENPSEKDEVAQIGMSDWLERNVREEEYVVMKGEAELVEEMVKSKAIRLVDELFLDCKSRGHGSQRNRKWAHWECLALYGRLRDEGVAVHQWWG